MVRGAVRTTSLDGPEFPLLATSSRVVFRADVDGFHTHPGVRGIEHRVGLLPNRERGLGEVHGVGDELDVAAALAVEVPARPGVPHVVAVAGSPSSGACRPSAATFQRSFGPRVVTTVSVTPASSTGHSAIHGHPAFERDVQRRGGEVRRRPGVDAAFDEFLGERPDRFGVGAPEFERALLEFGRDALAVFGDDERVRGFGEQLQEGAGCAVRE